MNRNKNLKIVGFFGQSGAGKTTVIRNVRSPINGNVIMPNTGIIRHLFQKNDYYISPIELLQKYGDELDEMKSVERGAKIDEIYEKYIRSQFQLLNDFSTEIYLATTEEYTNKGILLVDRSPIDFYALTICGMKYLQDQLKRKPNDLCKHFMELVRKTTEVNTKNFFNGIIVTNPWKAIDINTNLKDGIRDQYLNDAYTGDDWYNKMSDINLDGVKTFDIASTVTDLSRRAEIVELQLTEI